MPILMKLVAVCEGDGCRERVEYEAEVVHERDYFASSEHLAATEVKHDAPLPPSGGWGYGGSLYDVHRPLLCPRCNAEDKKEEPF